MVSMEAAITTHSNIFDDSFYSYQRHSVNNYEVNSIFLPVHRPLSCISGETDEFTRCNKSNRQESLNCGPNMVPISCYRSR